MTNPELLKALIPHRKSKQLVKGIRVENDTVIIKVKDNDTARWLCGEVLVAIFGLENKNAPPI